MRIRDIITEDQEVGEKQDHKIPADQKAAVPGMEKRPDMDNSSPYPGWRYSTTYLPGAGAKDGKYEHEPVKDGPIGQKLVTLAYSDGDEQILAQADKAFGTTAHRLSSRRSEEATDVHKVSPHRNPGPITRKR